eukprot:TRINITY_DN24115_c0_g1_i1.p1 TRINITY_DN24115_c0_g1~~TRINITY_DN24115_c0_g1_i1.p1  ORF type:complete len:394 (-),score=51.47 TRINITY_DN24115_c0_g1_i1:609-1637(-)
MEDAAIALPDFDAKRGIALFGVFDGHGGDAIARIVADRLPQVLSESAEYRLGQYGQALTRAYLLIDNFLDSNEGRTLVARVSGHSGPDLMGNDGPDGMGCTAVVALVRMGSQPELVVANAGDSRCVLISGTTAMDMSVDHTPLLASERRRILKAGGIVTSEGRIDGNLNLSRAIGDLAYKQNKKLKPHQQKISVVPEIKYHSLHTNDRYLILGCDGIFERASSQQLASFLIDELSTQPKISSACAAFLDKNLSKHPGRTKGLGCDNMSLMVIDLSALVPTQPHAPQLSSSSTQAADAASRRAQKVRRPQIWVTCRAWRRLIFLRQVRGSVSRCSQASDETSS